MNSYEELGRAVSKGLIFLVGEVRAADVRESGYVDTKTGLVAKSLVLTYFVEHRGVFGFEVIRLTRRIPSVVADPAAVPTYVEKGKIYAFEIESLERKNGNSFGRLSLREPEAVEIEGHATASPQGVAVVCP